MRRRAMYNEHFGLTRRPFRITPDTDLFFTGAKRGEILDALIYAITAGEGIVKVVGEVGSGKTMLCRMLELRLPDRVEVVYLANPSLTPADILYAIALEMGLDLDPETGRVQAMHALQRCLLEKHATGRRVVVLVEEAQGMPIATLEEIRLLSNLETKRDRLLQIALFGQPELDQLLDRSEIRQLRERITYSFELPPLAASEIQAYRTFRMRAVGYRGRDVFRKRAYAAMADASEGLTRRVNILADKALLAAYAEDAHDVRRRHVKVAIDDSEFGRRRRSRVPELAIVFGVVLLAVAVYERGPGASWWPRLAPAETAAATLSPRHVATEAAAEPPPATVTPERAPRSAPIEAAATLGKHNPDATVKAPGDQARKAIAEPDSAAARPGPVDAKLPPSDGPATAEHGAGLMLSERLVGSFKEPRGTHADVVVGDAARVPSPRPSAASVAASDPGRVSRPQAVVESVSKSTPEPVVEPVPVSVPETNRSVTLAAAPLPSASRTGRGNVPGGGDTLIDQRLAATHAWLRSADSGYYSIQLMLTDAGRRRNLEAFLRDRKRAGDLGRIFVYQTRIGRRARFGVLYGVYPTLSAARAALAELTPDLARYRPFIRNVRDVTSLG